MSMVVAPHSCQHLAFSVLILDILVGEHPIVRSGFLEDLKSPENNLNETSMRHRNFQGIVFLGVVLFWMSGKLEG